MRRPFGTGAGRVGRRRWRHACHRRLGFHRIDVFEGFSRRSAKNPFFCLRAGYGRNYS